MSQNDLTLQPRDTGRLQPKNIYNVRIWDPAQNLRTPEMWWEWKNNAAIFTVDPKNQTAFSCWNYSAIRSKHDWIYSLLMKGNIVPLNISWPHGWKNCEYHFWGAWHHLQQLCHPWFSEAQHDEQWRTAARLGISGFRRSVLSACKYHKYQSNLP